MLKTLFGIAALAAGTSVAAASFSVTPLAESTGGESITTALGFGGAGHIEYTGATGQAGLFSGLTLLGAQGTSMSLAGGVMLTSGSVLDLPAVNDSGWYSNATEGDPGSKAVKKIVPSTTSSRGGAGTHDANEFAFRFDAPVNGAGVVATAMTVRFVYASEEFPEWSGTIFSDGFAFYVKSSATASGLGTNHATFPTGEPISLLTQQINQNLLPNGVWGRDGQPGPALPQIAALPYDGFTRVLEFTAPIDEFDNRVTIAVSDTGDQIYDSAVFIAPVVFHFESAALGARLAPQSAGYLAMQPVPEPGEWALMLAGLGVVAAVARRRRGRTSGFAESGRPEKAPRSPVRRAGRTVGKSVTQGLRPNGSTGRASRAREPTAQPLNWSSGLGGEPASHPARGPARSAGIDGKASRAREPTAQPLNWTSGLGGEPARAFSPAACAARRSRRGPDRWRAARRSAVRERR